MSFLNLSDDVLIFTDLSRSAGGVIDPSGPAVARAISAGLTRLIEDVYFDPDRSRTPSWGELATYGRSGGENDLSGVLNFANTSECWTLGQSSQDLGPISTERHDEDGIVPVGEIGLWRPAGALAARQVGVHTLYLAVSTMDLRGSVQEDPAFDAVPLVTRGSRLTLVPSNNGCSACAVCGVCVICAEVNEASGIAATVGVSGVSGSLAGEHQPSTVVSLIEDTAEQWLVAAGLQTRVQLDRTVGA